jgi:hypothetical protein
MMSLFQRVTADEERNIATFMKSLSTHEPAEHQRVEDLRLLWLKGQLLRRWDAARRVHAPIDLADRLQLVGSLAALVAVVVWAL